MKIKTRLLHFSQFMYFTFTGFARNNLWESASSCTFGFVFSFIPVSLIIIAACTALIRVTPENLSFVTDYARQFLGPVNLDPVIENISAFHVFTFFDFFLGLWIIWMARKLFSSIVLAMNHIFRKASNRKPLLNQLVTILSEFFLVVGIVILIIAAFVMNKLLTLPVFESVIRLAPKFFSQLSNVLFSSGFYLILFILTFYIFRYISGTKPKRRICFFYAFLNTLAAFILSIFLNYFTSFSRYNIIYGTISTIIIMMFKVYLFFVVFLFCAQMIYASQFFKTLLLNEIYLLPSQEENHFIQTMRRTLFINPASLENSGNTFIFEGGSTIFTPDQKANSVFYVCSGYVALISQTKEPELISQGSFFGEKQCILGLNRDCTAIAKTQCKIIRISKADFTTMLHQNKKAAAKALNSLSLQI